MTNLDWIRSLNAKDLAEYLYLETYNSGYYDGMYDALHEGETCNFNQTEEWLNKEI